MLFNYIVELKTKKFLSVEAIAFLVNVHAKLQSKYYVLHRVQQKKKQTRISQTRTLKFLYDEKKHTHTYANSGFNSINDFNAIFLYCVQ